ncbi:MAG: tetratricopeptide repeat protein [Fimbriimonadaceae bacterium]|nr:tetratricopeptide repeat protein [Fimbriimonadaceae bacterium]
MEDPRKVINELFGILEDDVRDVKPGVASTKVGRDADESAALGEQCLEDGDFDAAIKHFQKALEQTPNPDAKEHLNLAAAYDVADREDEAITEYQLALRANKGATDAQVGVSDILRRNAKFRESIENLTSASKKDSKNPFHYFKLAEAYREIREYKLAVRAAEQAAQIGETDPFYWFWLADLLIELRRFEDALRPMKEAVDRSPGDDHLYLRASVAFWGAGKKAEAIKSMRLASELDPENAFYLALIDLYSLHSGTASDLALSGEPKPLDRYDQDRLDRVAEFLGIGR